MGSFLSTFSGNNSSDIFIDFENSRPTDPEQKLWDSIEALLVEAETVKQTIADYKSCKDQVSMAMRSRLPQDELKAFEDLLVAVTSIKEFYVFSQKLGGHFTEVLDHLARPPDDSKHTLSDCQALGKQLGDLLVFAIEFDYCRISVASSLANDFAFYRRMLNKFSNHEGITVNDDEANDMQPFTAQVSPMITALVEATQTLAVRNAFVCPSLAVMANSCMSMMRKHAFPNQKTNIFCARAMTGCIVLYDHVDDQKLGVFHRRSLINVKTAVSTLRQEINADITDKLVNIIHYSTLTFRDAPDSTKALFT
jgi:hypothetical protein